MYLYEVIKKKRDGLPLSKEEIKQLVNGYVAGEIPDYQMSALLMAIYFQGMDSVETGALTEAMAHSGEVLDLAKLGPKAVDKHSTGGVGDKTTLVIGPMAAACGLKLAKLSGRGLGHTGGTIDKLESIPGFRTSLSQEEFKRQVSDIGFAVAGQSGNLVPADKKLYALRDVTATVDSIPLIASSIMSKKIAAGSRRIVLDVKTGRGAFIQDHAETMKLAETMVDIGKEVGRKVTAVVSDMSQPLGRAVGNALEVSEAVQTLKGEGPADFRELCVTLVSEMLLLAGAVRTGEEGLALAEKSLTSGSALGVFREFVLRQGGDERVIDQDVLPRADVIRDLVSDVDGVIAGIDTLEVGVIANLLGAGRMKKDDLIDHGVGLVFHKKIGDKVESGETLVTVHAKAEGDYEKVKDRLRNAFLIGKEGTESPALIHEIIREDC